MSLTQPQGARRGRTVACPPSASPTAWANAVEQLPIYFRWSSSARARRGVTGQDSSESRHHNKGEHMKISCVVPPWISPCPKPPVITLPVQPPGWKEPND